MENILLTPYNRNGLKLKNHLVMAPMTRSRAIDNIPNDLMAEYYGQRSSAGLTRRVRVAIRIINRCK